MIPMWRHQGERARRIRDGLGFTLVALGELGLLQLIDVKLIDLDLGYWAFMPAIVLTLIMGLACFADLVSPVLRAVYEPLSVLLVGLGLSAVALYEGEAPLGLPMSWFWQAMVPFIAVTLSITVVLGHRAMHKQTGAERVV